MTHIPVTWKEEHEVIKVHCQPNVERGQESVLVASSDRYKALQRPSGVFWVRFNVPPTRRVFMEESGLRNYRESTKFLNRQILSDNTVQQTS